MANTNKPGAAAIRPAAGSSSNLQGMAGQAAVGAQGAMLTPALMQQQAAAAAAGGAIRPGMPYNFQMLQQQQMMLLAQQQAAAAAAAAGRAPSPAGAQQAGAQTGAAAARGAVAPRPVIITVPVRTQTGQAVLQPWPLPSDFVAANQELVQQNIGNPQTHMAIYSEYSRWMQQRAAMAAAGGGVRPAAPASSTAASTAAGPAAKRPKVDPAPAPGARTMVPTMQHPSVIAAMQGAAAAAGVARPPLHPGMAVPGMALQQQITAAQASAAAQAKLQASIAQKARFHSIVHPANEEEKQYVPKPRLQALVKQVGQGMGISSARVTEDAELALKAVTEDFISSAVSFAVSMARRRKSSEIEPSDLLLHLERTWNIQVPGFSRGDIRPYQRQQASQDHQRRMVAVRKAMAAAASSSGVQAGGKDGAAAAAGPAAAAAAGQAAQQPAAAGAGGSGTANAGAAAQQPAAAAAAATPATKGDGGSASASKAPAAAAAVKEKPPAQQMQQQAQQPGKAAAPGAAPAGGAAAADDDMPDLP